MPGLIRVPSGTFTMNTCLSWPSIYRTPVDSITIPVLWMATQILTSSWATIRETLKTHQVSTVVLPNSKRQTSSRPHGVDTRTRGQEALRAPAHRREGDDTRSMVVQIRKVVAKKSAKLL